MSGSKRGVFPFLASYRDLIRESFEKEPARSLAAAADRIEKMTGLRSGPRTFLCCLWSFVRLWVRAVSRRQRFNVLGTWNAVTRQLTYVANTTVVNTDTMCELLRNIAAENLIGPITVVLDSARYQRNAVVQTLAAELVRTRSTN